MFRSSIHVSAGGPEAAAALFVQLDFHRGPLRVLGPRRGERGFVAAEVVMLPIDDVPGQLENFSFAIVFDSEFDTSEGVFVDVESFSGSHRVASRKWIPASGTLPLSAESVASDLASWRLGYGAAVEKFIASKGIRMLDPQMFWIILDRETYLHADIAASWTSLDPLHPGRRLEPEQRRGRWDAISRLLGGQLMDRVYDRIDGQLPPWSELGEEMRRDVDLVAGILGALQASFSSESNLDALKQSFLRFGAGCYAPRVLKEGEDEYHLNGEPDSDAFVLIPEIVELMMESDAGRGWQAFLAYAVAALPAFGWVYQAHDGSREPGGYHREYFRSDRQQSIDFAATAASYADLNPGELQREWIRVLRRVYLDAHENPPQDALKPIEELLRMIPRA